MNNINDFTIKNGTLSRYKGKAAKVVVPVGVKTISARAFQRKNVREVILPDSVTKIGTEAFDECVHLNKICIPDTVTSIGEYAFRGCRSLENPILPKKLKKIGKGAFYGCAFLGKVDIPKGVTTIEEYTFYGCWHLNSVTVPDSVVSVDRYAFAGCTYLNSLSIPQKLTDIGAEAFKGCKMLADEDGFVIVNGALFDYVGEKTDIIIPDGVQRIAKGFTARAYDGILAYNHPDVLEQFIALGDIAGTPALTSIVIPPSVKTIEGIYGSKLTSVVIQGSETAIGKTTFNGCENLETLILPETITDIGNEAFKGCKKLADKDGFVIINGVLCDYAGDKADIVIPDSVREIDVAFYKNNSLKTVIIPDSVTHIRTCAFSDCTNLETVVIPNSVAYIGCYAFCDCKCLMEIYVPGSVTEIGENCFWNSESVVIHTPAGSCAEAYAKENGIPVVTV